MHAVALNYSFYTSFYPDVADLDEEKAVQHWLEHGQSEKRFNDIAAWIAGTPQVGAQLPKNFSVNLYRQLNPDLDGVLQHDWEYILHFVKHGQAEGRPCSISTDRFIADLYFDGAMPQPAMLEALLETQTVFRDLDELLTANGILSQAFLPLFSTPDYMTLQHVPLRNRMQCLRHFAETGRHALCPIALDKVFDPAFYAEIAPQAAALPAPDAYLHWINIGIAAGLAPNATDFLRTLGLTSTGDFPKGFDHRIYLAANPDLDGASAGVPNRWEALRHFVREGVAASRPGCTLGFGTVDLFLAAADMLSMRGQNVQAKPLYERVLMVDPRNSRGLRHYGDCLLRLGDSYAAAQIYERTIAAGHHNIWTHLNLAACQKAVGREDRGTTTLHALAHHHPGDRALQRRAEEAGEALFNNRRAHALWLSANGLHDEARDAMELAVGILVEPIAASLPDTCPSVRPVRTVLILADVSLPQCRFYRVLQKAEQLRAAGLAVELFDHASEIGGFIEALPRGDAAIFYRLPALPAQVRAIAAARRAGIPTFYEIDDLVFDGRYFPDSFESYGGLIDRDVYAGLITGAVLHRAAMSLCDYALASTRTLAAAMQPHVQSGRAFVHHNALGLQQTRLAASPPRPGRRDNLVRIFYGSGTRAHNEDFEIHAAPALAQVMDRHPGVSLIVVGYLALPQSLAHLAHRITTIEPVWDTAVYWGMLAEADINIAVLKPGHVADCKSEIKWLEAAMLRVPSVVSATQTHREIITHGEDGVLAGSAEEWEAALETLIESAPTRRHMGEAAHAKAIGTRSLDAGTASLLAMFEAVREKRPVPPRRRVLVVNVFFPPQAIGGAPRVVADNVQQICAEHGDEIEIEVFCTIEGGLVPYQLERYLWQGVRVTGVTTPSEPAIDLRVLDETMGRLFGEALDRFQPDLVHFHCIQRLTVSVCDAARARSIPYVVTVHDGWWISDHQFLIDDDLQPSRYQHDDPVAQLRAGGPTSLYRMRMLAAALSGADRVLAVSASFADIYRACGFPRIQVIENGVSPLMPAPRRLAADGTVRLAHIGGASPHKGYTLLRAALTNGRYPNLSLLLLDHTMAPGMEAVDLWGATPVRRRGKVPQAQVSELYAGIDILVATSIWPESYGLVTREALQAGCRIITSDRGAIGADVTGDSGFVVPVDSTAALEDVLARINADPAHYLTAPATVPRLRTSLDQAHELAQLYRAPLSDDWIAPPPASIGVASRAGLPSEPAGKPRQTRKALTPKGGACRHKA